MSKQMSSTSTGANLWPVPAPFDACGYPRLLMAAPGSPEAPRLTIVSSPRRAGKQAMIDGYVATLWELRRGVRNSESSRGSWYEA